MPAASRPGSAPRLDRPTEPAPAIGRIRSWLLWTLVIGLIGTEAELLLLEHYDERSQLVPIVLIALALGALFWHKIGRDAASLRALQIIMVLFVVASVAGLALHFRGAAEFQRELHPAIGTWELVKNVMRAKAPPVLAPGVMLQLGLIGLAYARVHSSNRS
jgi:hypothetical protein